MIFRVISSVIRITFWVRQAVLALDFSFKRML
jgi:hypothetical protein